MELDKLAFEDFRELLHKTMQVHFTDKVALPCELISLTELKGYSPLERKPFSFVIRSLQKDQYYSQGTVVIEHPSLGNLPVFISPIGFDETGMQYEAVFS
ncbi:hypothetical protein LAG90_02970 [Marinilongibacter aquaticus]|uniref:DUF6916 family protein n=1 Tax=Marinilongibacter aquaticus TaxID=2975157 RepID=UPI0021BDD7BC|nr:hypothetical protein [Marinilongibacter aquaticus]UBM59613.1 hypothetical protein LAG90_02970 [Marinilongibacter aquaticus]